MGYFTKLTDKQQEEMTVLQFGTFFEYFDLMLYINMAVLMNDLFFPKTNAFATSLLTAFAFCSTFVFRPFGALLFGYIGDHISRKRTIIITSLLMSGCCITLCCLPTYEQIGLTAALILTLCRAIQGISCMGEKVGAEVYLTEAIPLPARYPAVAWVTVSGGIGSLLALTLSTLTIRFSYDWRPVFFFGASIVVIASFARTYLRETPEALKRKNGKNKKELLEKVDPKTLIALFFIFCSSPIWFYFVYIYCGNVLKDTFGYTPLELMQNNLLASLFFVVINIVIAQVSYRIYPLKILKFLLGGMFIFVLLCPYFLSNLSTPFQVLVIQIFVATFGVGSFPAAAIFYNYLPVLKRMTLVGLSFALAQALMYVIISFGLVYLTLWLDTWGLWVIMIPSLISFAWALRHFGKLDIPNGRVMEPSFQNQETFLSEAA